ncbi:hypothetical protein [uncultured Paenibacillus sp.]|uniref:hypothetical protein n=1 Tax=uncultured Paenibacillus sp. TaxID=227322 RepID=UPI0015B0CE8C|nr:hypothetical protein [uncultured Paenibacillus sp.]
MLQKYATLLKFLVFAMVLLLTACSGGTAKPSANSEPSPPVKEEVTSPASENGNGNENAKGNAPESTRPAVADFDLMTGEGNQTFKANLQQGEGFSLYVFDKFAFDAAKGRLYLSKHPEYEVTIERLPSNYDLDQLKAKGQEELGTLGKISDYSGELVEHPLGFAEIYLQASGVDGIRDYIVWKSATGDAFLFRLRNPKGEEAADFAGPVLVSLSSVQSEL